MTLDVSSLKAKYSAIVDAYNNKSSILLEAKIISEWTVEDIKMWSKSVKEHHIEKTLDQHFYPEMLAVIKHANKLATGHELRIVQLLSLLLLLDAKDKGRLAEIAPAEGKTSIISMFAVIKYLQGHTVDVVTSSPVLADFAVQEKQKFYELFNATVACNWDEKFAPKFTPLESGFKTCYSANIVYGDAHSFQWDALRHEYEQDGTRGSRPYDTVIIDEVDSLLIDDAAHSAQLAGPRPAFEFLESLLVACWQELIRINQGFSTINGTFHWQADPDSTPHIIPDPQEFLIGALSDYLHTVINQADSALFIPKHLKEFASEQTRAWAQSAVLALNSYTLGQHYTIASNGRQRVIAPVDNMSTGVIQINSNWPDGLHQFLQMKEGLKLSVESLVACYISNMSFFRRYKKAIYGLSGTLGAEPEQRLLADTYNMDFVKVPTHKPVRFTEYEGALAEDADSWLEAIVNSTSSAVRSGRPVLIICESMNAVAQIQKDLLASGIDPQKIKRYTKTDESNAVNQIMNAGDIIIATNLAGRGTDIKTAPEVAASGGLHVCVTFMPRNLRVEYQAFRRTARHGNPGSAQLIINKKEAFALLSAHGINTGSIRTVPELKKQRDLMESLRLRQIREYEVKKIAIKDELFEEFCSFSNTLGSKKKLVEKYRLKDVEELWSVWLHKTIIKMNCATEINRDQIMQDFIAFKVKAEQLYKSGQISNPCYLVCSGNDFGYTKKPELAFAAYDKAIALDPILAVHAYYNRALALIDTRRDGYKGQAITDLCVAQKIIIETLIPQVQAVPILASFALGSKPNTDNELSQQASAKVALYKKQLDYIDKAIKVLETTKGDIHISGYHSLAITFNPGDANHESEIVEFNAAGLEHFFEIEEAWYEKKKDIFGVVCCVFIGLCQIVVGSFCYATGNAFLGEVLIKEGVGDVMYALRKAIDGNFSWKEYREHKAISVAITVATTGIDKIKQRAQTASKTSKAVTQQSANNVRQNASLEQVRSENALRAKQLVAKTVIQRAAQEVASVVTDRVIDVSIKHFKEDIKQSVKKNLLDDLDRVDVKNAVDKLINVHQQAAILKIAFGIINHENGKFARMFKAVAKGIVAHLNPATAAAVRLFTLHEALSEIKRLTDTFSADFSGKIIALANSLPESRSPMPQQKVDEIRTSVYAQIIDTITQGVMGQLRHGVAKPIVDQITEDQVQKIADALHRSYVRKTTQPPQSLVVCKPMQSPVPPEKVPVEILPRKPGKGLLYSEIVPGGFYPPGGGMDVSQFTFPSAAAPQGRFNRPASEYGMAVVQAAKNLVKPTIEFFTDCNLISVSQWPKPHSDNHHPLAQMSLATHENPQLVVDAQHRMRHRFKTLKSVGSFLWDAVILWDTRPTGTMTEWSEPMNQLQTDAMARMTYRMRMVTYFGKWVVKEATGPQLTEISVVTAIPFVPKVYRTISKAKQNYTRFGTLTEPYKFPDLFPGIKAPLEAGPPLIFSPQELQNSFGTKRGIYVVNPEGKLILGSQDGRGRHYHSSYANEIVVGGQYKIWNGKEAHIDNNTGHFRAYGDEAAKIAVRTFKEAGFEQVTYTKYAPLNFQEKLDAVITSYVVTSRNPTWSGAIAHLDSEFTASLIYTSPVKKSLSPEVISLLDKKFINPLFKQSDHLFREEIPRLLRDKVFPGVDTLKNSMVVASPATIGFFNQTRAEIPSNLINERGVSIDLMPGTGYTGHAQVTDGVIDYGNKMLFWKLPSRIPPDPKDLIPVHPMPSDELEDNDFSELFYDEFR